MLDHWIISKSPIINPQCPKKCWFREYGFGRQSYRDLHLWQHISQPTILSIFRNPRSVQRRKTWETAAAEREPVLSKWKRQSSQAVICAGSQVEEELSVCLCIYIYIYFHFNHIGLNLSTIINLHQHSARFTTPHQPSQASDQHPASNCIVTARFVAVTVPWLEGCSPCRCFDNPLVTGNLQESSMMILRFFDADFQLPNEIDKPDPQVIWCVFSPISNTSPDQIQYIRK